MDLSFLPGKAVATSNIAVDVSILVLMDLSFLHDLKRDIYQSMLEGFNPCSYGSFVLTSYSNIIKDFI